MMTLSPEERETIILLSDADDTYDLYTRQQKIMNRMNKQGIIPYQVEKDEEENIVAAYYKLQYKQISYRKIIEPTEEQKEQRRLRGLHMAKSRQNQNSDADSLSE